MATELVKSATSEKLGEMDWTKNIEICEFVARDPSLARDVVKAVKKRLTSKHPNAQLYAVLLLEMLMNNIGENVHKQVIETGVLPILVKIVKRKSDLQVRERIFLLLDATQTSVGGANGKFPQYYTAYFELVSAGVQFPQRSSEAASQARTVAHNEEVAAPRNEIVAPQTKPEDVPESSIIQKATNALEVLKEVLGAVDPRNPEAAKDEFTLDLVEQCSFQKQRVMHLVMSSRNEKLILQAIELNEQLQRILTRHDALLSSRPTPTDMFTVPDRVTSTTNHIAVPNRASRAVNHINHEESEEEEEEPEQLFRRLRKGKTCARPEDEGNSGANHSVIPAEMLNRPLIRPLSSSQPAVVIPPPPAKHVERERFFKETKADGSAVAGHMRGLSLHSHSGGSSRSGSTDFSN